MPLNAEIWLDGVVAVLLLITVIYCLILNRRLTALRGNQAEMRQLVSQFTLATRQAEASVGELKDAGDSVGAVLDRRIREGRALADELASITQSGTSLADRIEKGLVGRSAQSNRAVARESFEGGPAEVAPVNLSESERELAEILRQAR